MKQTANHLSQFNILNSYYSEIKGHELLSRQQEKALARQYRDNGDEAAAERLVRANLRLVVKIARDYCGNNDRYALSDLVQEGNLGLVHAVRHYNPGKGTKFSYYASFWIKAYILKYLMNNYSSVKIGTTQAQRKLFFNLQKTKEKLLGEGLPVTPEAIAKQIGVKRSEVEEMDARMGHEDRSLNAPSRGREHEQMLDSIRGDGDSVEESVAGLQVRQLVHTLLARFKPSLDGREQDILERRIVALEPLTLKKLGDRYGVSRERIRQIEANILRKLRLFFKSEVADYHSYLTV